MNPAVMRGNAVAVASRGDGRSAPREHVVGGDRPLLLAGDESTISATDAIIEELKTLAKSMLDATNAARKRSKIIESRPLHGTLAKAAAVAAAGGRRRMGRLPGRTVGESESVTSSGVGQGGSNHGFSSKSNSLRSENRSSNNMKNSRSDAAAPALKTRSASERHGWPDASIIPPPSIFGASAPYTSSSSTSAAGAPRSAPHAPHGEEQSQQQRDATAVDAIVLSTGSPPAGGRKAAGHAPAAAGVDVRPEEADIDSAALPAVACAPHRERDGEDADCLAAEALLSAAGEKDGVVASTHYDCTAIDFDMRDASSVATAATSMNARSTVAGDSSSGNTREDDDEQDNYTTTRHDERRRSNVHAHLDESATEQEYEGEGEDDTDSVFDGVKRHVFFRATDQEAYSVIVASAWKPEAITRTLHSRPRSSAAAAAGESRHAWKTPSQPGDVSRHRAGDRAEGGSALTHTVGVATGHGSCSASRETSKITSHAEGEDGEERGDDGDDSTEEEDDDEGDSEVLVTSRGRSVQGGEGKAVKVYRIPAYPYGGGITASQAHELQRKFEACIRAHPRQSADGMTQPTFVTAKSFRSYAYSEVDGSTQTAHNTFNPRSPYEFVVEVERSVVFDAARAREERRRAFGHLVKLGSAPATVGTFNLRVIMDPIKTGFEEEKTFPIVPGSVVADRYQIIQLIGKATFSRAVRCYDLMQPIYDDTDNCNTEDEGGSAGPRYEEDGGAREPVGYAEVCLKIINNSKDFFDQSLDEIRLLTLINQFKDPDEAHVVRLIDSFYYREHTMLVTELLSDNLYEYSRYNRDEEDEPYFTLPRLRRIALQITEALSYVHSLNLIHADLKPENVLFVSHRRCIVKVIDFGSSCYLSDHLSSYIQSRSYRAPEVVLGCDYDGRIDVWSLGAILVELITGEVLFTSETVCEMLARIVYVCGMPLPRRMLWEGRHTNHFINKFGCIYECGGSGGSAGATTSKDNNASGNFKDDEGPCYLYTPVPPQHVHAPIPSASHTPLRPTTGLESNTPKNTTVPNDARKEDACDNTSVGDNKTRASNAPDDDTSQGYAVLRQKLRAAGEEDPLLISFITACLTLDHKRRPTSHELLSHPFLSDVSNKP